ncbi:MBL fold metallo-hydrolase [Mesorhizobium huakuii]|uniref:MBL fold metallo-hydrolase n=1 Tax=Mesorhizobium huakuii TaxID=28104 RepID=A0A7G6SZW1_9HYPH|nr:hypothetical protein HB778_28460 [Mesorhizobium huakuii]
MREPSNRAGETIAVRKLVLGYLFVSPDISPGGKLKEHFIVDVSGPDRMTITLIGGPTALIEIAGIRFLTDPTFDVPQAYDAGAVRLVKQSGPAIGIDSLPPIDLVLLSHDQHLEHFP